VTDASEIASIPLVVQLLFCPAVAAQDLPDAYPTARTGGLYMINQALIFYDAGSGRVSTFIAYSTRQLNQQISRMLRWP